MTSTTDSPRALFDRLSRIDPPVRTPVLFDTACVLGGSIAGLLAARVLADHASRVLIIERDAVDSEDNLRQGVPQGRQAHVLLPGGLAQIERWLPGFTREAQDRGGVLARPDQQAVYLGGRQQVPQRNTSLLTGTRPFLESRIRSRVLALPNVSALTAQATGLEFDDGAVRAVRYVEEQQEKAIDVDFVVDAIGRSSKVSRWVEEAGFQRPKLQRLSTNINYATALFERPPGAAELPVALSFWRLAGPSKPDALVLAVEGDQWLVLLYSYEPDRPPASIEGFRETCAKLPPIFGHAVSGPPTCEVQTYRQADSRRRDFTGLARFPARLVSVGDAVASFNPVHGQGISSAALHASCLSDYLVATPPLNRPATSFFDLQVVVTDAAWALSTEADTARHDALHGTELPEDVAHHRWAMDQVLQATLVDQSISDVFTSVVHTLAHPSILADSALVERAIAANKRAS